MNPRDVFERHFLSATMLLRVYRLLQSEGGPKREHDFLVMYRDYFDCNDEEELIVLLNQFFIGIVREGADAHMKDFRHESLDLLLRQSVAAACTALDVYIPQLLRTYLTPILMVRGRNIATGKGEIKSFFDSFSLKLEDVWALADAETADERWETIAARIIAYYDRKTSANEQGIATALLLLQVEEPWAQIAHHVEEKEQVLRERLNNVTKRRNRIIHAADRPISDPSGPATPIDYIWTKHHVETVETVALASYELVKTKAQELGIVVAG